MLTKTACLPWLEIPTSFPWTRDFRWTISVRGSSLLSHQTPHPFFLHNGINDLSWFAFSWKFWVLFRFYSYSKHWHSINRKNEYIGENTVCTYRVKLIIYETKLFTLCNIFNLNLQSTHQNTALHKETSLRIESMAGTKLSIVKTCLRLQTQNQSDVYVL